jgi:hypothetical protein
MKKEIVDVIFGTVELIDMTPNEVKEYEAYKAKADVEIAEVVANQESKALAKAAAQAKLAALGLTISDLEALGL